jgi:hypothetical protein
MVGDDQRLVAPSLTTAHEALCTTPAKAPGVADKAWSIAQLVDAALSVALVPPAEAIAFIGQEQPNLDWRLVLVA